MQGFRAKTKNCPVLDTQYIQHPRVVRGNPNRCPCVPPAPPTTTTTTAPPTTTTLPPTTTTTTTSSYLRMWYPASGSPPVANDIATDGSGTWVAVGFDTNNQNIRYSST